MPTDGAARPREQTLRLAVLVNSGGGTVRREGADALRERLATAFREHGVEAELVFAAGPDLRRESEAALGRAREGALDGIVVGGGDGSVGTLAGLLADTGVAMGVLPLGTLNHFARDVGMPADLDAAVAVIARGRTRPVDVGEVNGRVFVNNSLIGIYPRMVADRERRRERHGLGKWPAMTLALIKALARFPRRRVTLRVAGRETPYRTPLLFVGVNEYSLERFQVRRHGGMSDGKLWLIIAKHDRPLGLVALGLRAALGGLKPAKDFDELHVESCEVTFRASRMPVSHDGEIDRMRGPLRYRVRAGALRVLADPEEEAAA